MYTKAAFLLLISFSSFTLYGEEHRRILCSHLGILENFLNTAFDLKHSRELIHQDFGIILDTLRKDPKKVSALNTEAVLLTRDFLGKLCSLANSYYQFLHEASPLLKDGPECSIVAFKARIEAFFSQALADIDTFFDEEWTKLTILKPMLSAVFVSFKENKNEVLQTLWQNVNIEPLSEENHKAIEQELVKLEAFIKTKIMILDSRAFKPGFEWIFRPYNQRKFYEVVLKEDYTVKKTELLTDIENTICFRLVRFQGDLNIFAWTIKDFRTLKMFFNVCSALGLGRFIINWDNFLTDADIEKNMKKWQKA